MKLKQIGFREEYLPAVNQNGERTPGVQIYHEIKSYLQCASKLLAVDPRTQSASLTNNTGDNLNVSEAQTGSGIQLQQRAGLTCPQQQQVPTVRGGGVPITPHQQRAGLTCPQQQVPTAARGRGVPITPHQFGLTPFQSMCKHIKI